MVINIVKTSVIEGDPYIDDTGDTIEVITFWILHRYLRLNFCFFLLRQNLTEFGV